MRQSILCINARYSTCIFVIDFIPFSAVKQNSSKKKDQCSTVQMDVIIISRTRKERMSTVYLSVYYAFNWLSTGIFFHERWFHRHQNESILNEKIIDFSLRKDSIMSFAISFSKTIVQSKWSDFSCYMYTLNKEFRRSR